HLPRSLKRVVSEALKDKDLPIETNAPANMDASDAAKKMAKQKTEAVQEWEAIENGECAFLCVLPRNSGSGPKRGPFPPVTITVGGKFSVDTLKVATTDWEPFIQHSLADGKQQRAGLYVFLLDWVAKNTDVKIEYQALYPSDAIKALKSGEKHFAIGFV